MENITRFLMLFVLFISILEIFREMWKLFLCYLRQEVFELSDIRLAGLWSAISYIMALIFI